jgi:hypothetical protein
MARRILARAGMLALTMTVAGCQPQAQSWPTQPADLSGRVLDVQLVRGIGGLEVQPSPGASNGGDIRRLRIRVASSRRAAPGTEAYIGLDGVTQVARGVVGSDNGASELQGAFVRVWFRGLPRTSTPTATVAMARLVAIDSVAERGAGR